MPIIEPDLSEVESIKPMEPGTYRATCLTAVPKTSSSGNPMLEVESEVDYNGQTRKKKDWIVTSGKAAYKFENFLRAVGMDEAADKLRAKERFPIDTDNFLGATYNVVVEADTYNGEPTDRISKYLKI